MRIKSAYTLLEFIVVLGIFMIISLVVIPISVTQLQKQRTLDATKELFSNTFRIQQNAYSQKEDSAYGVAFFSNKYIWFKGNSLSAATDSGEIFFSSNLQTNNINISGGGNEILFPPGNFRPANAGSLQLTDGYVSYELTVSSEGLIDFYKL